MACLKILAPAPSYPMPVPCRPSTLAGFFKGLPSKQTLFFGGVLSFKNSHGPAMGPAHLATLQVVNTQKRQVNSGSKSDGKVLRSEEKPSWDSTNALAVSEGFFIVVAAVSYTTTVLNRNKQASLVASSSAEEGFKLLPKLGEFSTWYAPALWAALVINVILRTVQRRTSTKSTQKVWEERSIRDFTLDQRVGKLEEDVQGVAAIARMLARHLEKLGVRFRVTRRTLRDPIQETVILNKKTAEVVRALASREQALEKELTETQRSLVAMQAQQAKQLELLVAGMRKTLKSQQESERRILKEISRRLGEGTHSSKDTQLSVSSSKEKGKAPPGSRKKQGIRDIGTLLRGLKTNLETSKSSATSSSQMKGAKGEAKEEKSIVKGNGYAGLTPETMERPSKESTFNPDTRFSKEDFWATATPRETHAGSQEIPEIDTDPKDVPERHSSDSTSRMGSFFSNRKRGNSQLKDTRTHKRDFSDPGSDQFYSQSGEHSSGSTNGFS